MKLPASSRFAIRFIEVYRAQVSPKLGTACPFEPSCSEFALQAFRKYGFFKATSKVVGRLSRCRKGYKGSLIDPLN